MKKRSHNWQDLTGRKIHKLTFVEYKGNSKWLCICDCGNEKEVVASNVKHGLTKGCGCMTGHNLERDRPRSTKSSFDAVTGKFTCHIHGETSWYNHGSGSKRCVECNQKIQTERRRQFKEQAVQYKGGKCSVCGYDKCLDALDFHHVDPNTKDSLVSKLMNTNWEKIKVEVDKCVLLCSNCHREEHSKLNSPLIQR